MDRFKQKIAKRKILEGAMQDLASWWSGYKAKSRPSTTMNQANPTVKAMSKPSPVGTQSGPAVSDYTRLPYPAAVAKERARNLRSKIMNTPQTKVSDTGPTQTAKPATPKLVAKASPNLRTVKATSTPPASITKGNYVNQPYPKAAAVKNAYDVKDRGPTSTVKATKANPNSVGVGRFAQPAIRDSSVKGTKIVNPATSEITPGLDAISKLASVPVKAFDKISGTNISGRIKPSKEGRPTKASVIAQAAHDKATQAKPVQGDIKKAEPVTMSPPVQASAAPSTTLKTNPPELVQKGFKGITNAAQLAAQQLSKTVGPGKTIDVRQQNAAAAEKPTPLPASRNNSGVSDASKFWASTSGKAPYSKEAQAKAQVTAKQGTLNRVNPQVGASAPKSGLAGSPSGSRARPSPNLGSAKNTGAQVAGQPGSPSGTAPTPVKTSMPIPTAKPSSARVTASTPKPSSNVRAKRQRGVRRTPSSSSRKSNWGFHGTATRTASKGLSAGAITNRALGGVYEEKLPEAVKESFESFIRNKFLKENHE